MHHTKREIAERSTGAEKQFHLRRNGPTMAGRVQKQNTGRARHTSTVTYGIIFPVLSELASSVGTLISSPHNLTLATMLHRHSKPVSLKSHQDLREGRGFRTPPHPQVAARSWTPPPPPPLFGKEAQPQPAAAVRSDILRAFRRTRPQRTTRRRRARLLRRCSSKEKFTRRFSGTGNLLAGFSVSN